MENNLNNNPTFTNSTTVFQPEQTLSNVNYNDVNATDPSVISPAFHTNNNYSDQLPMPNGNISLTSQSASSPYVPQYPHYPQYLGPQQLHNSLNMATSHSGIFSFDIPGFKVIFVPATSTSQQDNAYLNCSSTNTSNQFTQFRQ